ncbi:MAG: type VI secretion system tube protein TssD [Bacteroidales bacterium]
MKFAIQSNPIGDDIKVMECDFGFTQQIDITGKPSARPMGGTINLKVESTDNTELADWMISSEGMKDGRIDFTLRDNKFKTLSFEKGVCIQYHEAFDYEGSIPMHISLISASKITIGSIEFSLNGRYNSSILILHLIK